MDARIYFLAILLIIANVNTGAQTWKALNGPTGASTVSSIITYEKGEIYTLIQSGKMFRSLDKAKTWENISAGLQQIENKLSDQLKLKEAPSGEIFLSSGKLLYRYIPALKFWMIISEDIEIEDFAFSPDGRTMYVSNNSGLYISVNGSNFNQVQSWSAQPVEFLCLGNNNNFISKDLVTYRELWKFNDDGSNLKKVTEFDCCINMFFHKKSNTLFDLSYRTRISRDYGVTWLYLSLLSNLYFQKMLELEDGSILAFDNGVYKSVDNGKTWIEPSNYNVNRIGFIIDYNAKISWTKKGELVICNNGNSYYLDGNANSYTFQMPVIESNVFEIAQFGQKNIFCNTNSSNQLSIDDGLSWKILPTNGSNNKLFWKDGTMAYYIDDSIFVTKDQFITQQKKALPAFTYADNLLLDNNENIILLGYNNSYISYDKGDSWNLIGENLQIPLCADKYKISKQNIIYAFGYADTIYYSADFGLTWEKFSTSIVFDPKLYLSENNVFMWESQSQTTFKNVCMYTKDFGATIEELKFLDDETIWLFDDNANVYSSNIISVNSMRVTNLLTKQVSYISLNGFNKRPEEITRLIQGDNGYLYITSDSSPIYKYSEKLENELGIISGQVFIDENQDCTKSGTELNTRAFQMDISGSKNNFQIPIFADGKFKVNVPPGDYSLNLKSKSLLWEQCNFPTKINVQAKFENKYNELLVKPIEYCADLSTNVVLNRLRRCFDNNSAYLTIKNEGSISSRNTVVKVIMDDYFENIQSSISPMTVNGNFWSFNISEIKPGETYRIKFEFKVSCTAEINQLHCILYITENKQECKGFSTLVDTSIVCEKNVGSFDPNDKTAFVNGKPSDFLYQKDSTIEYLIRFQNTGTDTAFNISLTDKLDYNLDWSSFRALTASHDYTYSINETGLLEVFFKNIMLADSNISEANSHGFFKFSIKPKPGLKNRTLINNIADIYFDFNEAVRTNMAKLVLSPLLKVKDFNGEKIIELQAIPNPVNQSTEIALPESWHNTVVHTTLLSLEGKVLQRFDLISNKLFLERNKLSSGMYYLNLINKEGRRAYCKIIFN